jgi:hypothetical protein
VDRTKLKNLLKFNIAEFKKMHTELRAYEMTLASLKAALGRDYPDFPALADGALTTARQSPVLHETMRKQYDEPLERFLQQVSEAETDEKVEELLLAMPVSKFVN